VLKINSPFVPVDPDFPLERQKYMKKISSSSFTVDEMFVLSLNFSAKQTTIQRPIVLHQAPAYIIFTSGSTGFPKGTILQQSSLYNHHMWFQTVCQVGNWDRHLYRGSISFDATLIELLLPHLYGACLDILQPSVFDQDTVASVFVLHHITLMSTVPSFLDALLATEENRNKLCNCEIRWIDIGGEVLRQHTIDNLFNICPDCTVLNAYGPTEATIDSTAKLVNSRSNKQPSIGRPIKNYLLYCGNLFGCTAELLISGIGLALGYIRRGEETAKVFVPNIWGNKPTSSRTYKTGDLCRFLQDGNVQYLGRVGNQVKIRGFRVELEEIETVVNRHVHVYECVVTVNYLQSLLTAHVVLKQSATGVDSLELKKYLSNKVPNYMIPSIIRILPELPLTPNGKVDRKALAAISSNYANDAFCVAPQTPNQIKLTRLWKKLLGLKQVGIHDNFFELGGHSLLVTQLVSRIQKQLNVKIPLRSVFESPTIAVLSEIVDHQQDQIRTNETKSSFQLQTFW